MTESAIELQNILEKAISPGFRDRLLDKGLARGWSEPLRVDKKLSNADSWREVHEEDQAALRPGLQDISISRT